MTDETDRAFNVFSFGWNVRLRAFFDKPTIMYSFLSYTQYIRNTSGFRTMAGLDFNSKRTLLVSKRNDAWRKRRQKKGKN